MKRGVDVAAASVLLVAVLPVLALVVLVIFLVDGRPILFRQTRIGRGGTPFTMYKFRTMAPDAEARLPELLGANERSGPLFKLGADPRVTRVGRVLRRWSLDELPQLLNVLAGTMSLVGPRPALPAEVAQFSEEFSRARNSVRPGVTGLWQVYGRADSSFELYERLDLQYVNCWTLGLEISILLRTVPAVVKHAVPRTRRLAVDQVAIEVGREDFASVAGIIEAQAASHVG